MLQTKLYPHFVLENNKKPSKLYAFPVLAIMAKVVFLIPVFLEIIVLEIFSFFLLVITWFIVLFTGKYWDFSYKFFLGLIRLETKIGIFLLGLTDKYPGFSFSANGLFELTIPKPEKPSRLLAFPFVGILIRIIMTIPYAIFSEVLHRGSVIALVISWFAVLFKGKFPESLYEFERDFLRVMIALQLYGVGLSDSYPSFAISMNRQTVKLLLIIAGALLVGMSWRANDSSPSRSSNPNTMQYQPLPQNTNSIPSY